MPSPGNYVSVYLIILLLQKVPTFALAFLSDRSKALQGKRCHTPLHPTVSSSTWTYFYSVNLQIEVPSAGPAGHPLHVAHVSIAATATPHFCLPFLLIPHSFVPTAPPMPPPPQGGVAHKHWRRAGVIALSCGPYQQM